MPLIRFIGFSIHAVSVHNNNLILAYFQHLQNSYQILRAFEANLFSAIDFSQLRDRARTEFSNKISSGVENRLSSIQLTDGDGSAKSLTAYVGLDPVDFQSGTSVYRRSTISKQGNQRLRKYLFLGALGGVRGHNPLREFHQRLIDRGKPYKVALIACARKILVWSWAIFVNNTTFDIEISKG